LRILSTPAGSWRFLPESVPNGIPRSLCRRRGCKSRRWHGAVGGAEPSWAGSRAGLPRQILSFGRRTSGDSEPPPPFTDNALDQNKVRRGLLAKSAPFRDACRSSISSSLRPLSRFTVRPSERRFSASTNLLAADPPRLGPSLPQPGFQPEHQPIPAPSSKSAPCVAGRGLAFVEGRSAMRSKLSIQAIGLIGQIEKIEHVGIRKIPGRSESRHC